MYMSSDFSVSSDEVSLNSLDTQTTSDPPSIYHALYGDMSLASIKAISRSSRKRNGYSSNTLNYGDIELNEMKRILEFLEENGLEYGARTTFVDVGCGVGKAVFSAALLGDFARTTGIEILRDLVDVCEQKLQRWNKICLKLKLRRKIQMDLNFIAGDFTICDWSLATVVFIHATAFDSPLMDKLLIQCEALPLDSFVVCVSRELTSRVLHMLGSLPVDVSWGATRAFVYQRVPFDETAGGSGGKGTLSDDDFLRKLGLIHST